MKFRAADWAPIIAQLTAWGAISRPTRKDADHYFNAGDRDFAKTDEAVRLRRIGTSNFLTYKGPKIDTLTKTRKEVELPLANGPENAATAVRFLSALGFKPVAVVSKLRDVYTFTRDDFHIEACLDDVGAVGKFVELEIQAEEDQFEPARAVLMRTAVELGLTQQERLSYLGLLLAQSGT